MNSEVKNNGINWEAWGFTIEDIPRRKIITASPYDLGSYAYEKVKDAGELLRKPSHYAWLSLLRKVKENNAILYEDWYDYCTFEKWYDSNMYEFNGEEIYLKNGYWGDENTYSPETCVFVPKSIVNMLRMDFLESYKKKKRKYNLPVGIAYGRNSNGSINSGRYIISLSFTEIGKSIILGHADTLEEAFYFYKHMKEAHIKLFAESVKDKIPACLYNYMCQFTWDDKLENYTEVK